MSIALPLPFPVVTHSLAALRLGVSALELELFVFLGTASGVLRLGLPLFLLYGDKRAEMMRGRKKKEEAFNIQMLLQRNN